MGKVGGDIVVLEAEEEEDEGEGTKVRNEYKFPGYEVRGVAVGYGERLCG